jgi:hypothetical protein
MERLALNTLAAGAHVIEQDGVGGIDKVEISYDQVYDATSMAEKY